MVPIRALLMIVAFLLFVLAAIGIPSSRINLVAAGLAFWILATMI